MTGATGGPRDLCDTLHHQMDVSGALRERSHFLSESPTCSRPPWTLAAVEGRQGLAKASPGPQDEGAQPCSKAVVEV